MKHATTLMAFCAAALLSLGLVALFSSSVEFSVFGPVGFQVLWCGLGLVAAAIAAALDYRWLKRAAWGVYGLALVLLGLVLLLGEERNGAVRWLDLGRLSFQPSEFAKLALVVALAYYGERYGRRMRTFVGGLFMPGMLAGAILGLVFLEPDWGTTLLLAAVTGVLLLVAGARWSHVLPVVMAGSVALVLVLLENPVRLQRVRSWWNPEATREGVGYQAYQAKLALGSGGWTGSGLGNGEHYGYVPENQTDFILSIVGEELGLASTLGVVLAFGVFVICGVCVAWGSRDVFGLLLGTGLTFLVGLQAFINIGVVTGLLPNKGLPLPLVSKGGSSLFMMLVFVGLLLSIARTTARERAAAFEVEPEMEDLPATQFS